MIKVGFFFQLLQIREESICLHCLKPRSGVCKLDSPLIFSFSLNVKLTSCSMQMHGRGLRP